MRTSMRAIWTVTCVLTFTPLGWGEEAGVPPSAENVAHVKGFVVQGTLKQVIGSFNTHGHPRIGDTFEIRLANLPADRIDFARGANDQDPNSSPYTAYVPFQGPLGIEAVDKRTRNHGSSLIRLTANRAEQKFVIQVRAPELENKSKATIFFYSESYGRILCMAEAEGVLIEQPIAASQAPAVDGFVLEYPKKEHLSAQQLYGMVNTATAIEKIVGQLVLLDVVVKTERTVPLVEIEIPAELASGAKPPQDAISAHIVGVTSEAASFKQGERRRIEGVIVDEGFGAYMIYLCKSKRLH